MDASKSTTIKVNLPIKTLQAIQAEVDRFGWSVQDFIRMRIQNYFLDTDDLTLQEKKDITKAELDLKKGNFKTFSSADKLREYLTGL